MQKQLLEWTHICYSIDGSLAQGCAQSSRSGSFWVQEKRNKLGLAMLWQQASRLANHMTKRKWFSTLLGQASLGWRGYFISTGPEPLWFNTVLGPQVQYNDLGWTEKRKTWSMSSWIPSSLRKRGNRESNFPTRNKLTTSNNYNKKPNWLWAS